MNATLFPVSITVHLELREHACPYCPGVAFGKADPEDAHQDGAREAQGPRVPLLPRRRLRGEEHPDEARQLGALEAARARVPLLPRRRLPDQHKSYLKTHIKTVHEKREAQ